MPKLPAVLLLIGLLQYQGGFAQVGSHSLSFAPLGLIGPSKTNIANAHNISSNQHAHWDYMYQIKPKVSFRLGIDHSTEIHKDAWRTGNTYNERRTRGAFLGLNLQIDSSRDASFSAAFSCQLGLLKTIWLSESHGHAQHYVGSQLITTPTSSTQTGSILNSATRFSVYMALQISPNVFVYFDPAIVINQYRENGIRGDLEYRFSSNRLLGFGIRI